MSSFPAEPAAPDLAILVAGVGGQGVLTAARVLGEAACAAGLDFMAGQLHGMAQRGGSVEATLRLGSRWTAGIGAGGAGVVVGFEPLETLRALPKTSAGATVLVNRGRIVPFAMTRERIDYPDLGRILGQVGDAVRAVHLVDGPRILAEVGNPRLLSAVMLGALAALGVLPFDGAAVQDALDAVSPAGDRRSNRRAFALARTRQGVGGAGGRTERT